MRSRIFATSVFFDGLQLRAHWMRSGEPARPDLIIAAPAWPRHLAVVVGCASGYARLAQKRRLDRPGAVVTFALTTRVLALDMWVCQPRHLPLFRAMRHPHLRF